MKTVDVAKVVVLNPAGQVLLLRRSNSDSRRPGQWDFPGGGVETGESFPQAAARELLEEIGVAVVPTDLELIYSGTDYWEPDEVIHNRCLYKLKVRDEQALTLSHEHESYQWTEVQTALSEFKHHFYNTGLRFADEHHLL